MQFGSIGSRDGPIPQLCDRQAHRSAITIKRGFVRLNGRVALVTGSGTGIGRAISELFANEGAKVALNYHHSRDGAEELASRIRSKGGRAMPIACDVSKELEVRSMIDRTHAEFGAAGYPREQCRLEHGHSSLQTRGTHGRNLGQDARHEPARMLFIAFALPVPFFARASRHFRYQCGFHFGHNRRGQFYCLRSIKGGHADDD